MQGEEEEDGAEGDVHTQHEPSDLPAFLNHTLLSSSLGVIRTSCFGSEQKEKLPSKKAGQVGRRGLQQQLQAKGNLLLPLPDRNVSPQICLQLLETFRSAK